MQIQCESRRMPFVRGLRQKNSPQRSTCTQQTNQVTSRHCQYIGAMPEERHMSHSYYTNGRELVRMNFYTSRTLFPLWCEQIIRTSGNRLSNRRTFDILKSIHLPPSIPRAFFYIRRAAVEILFLCIDVSPITIKKTYIIFCFRFAWKPIMLLAPSESHILTTVS